tara:strand:- start:13 stop:894 length:882 start_codon:yes stop_codon:yes gene_type:complete
MGIPAYDEDNSFNTDLDEDYAADQAGPGDPGYEGPEDGGSANEITEEQSRAAVAENLGPNYDPESLSTPSFIDAKGNIVDVPSYGFDESDNFIEIDDIGRTPQGGIETDREFQDYFFGPQDGGSVKEGPGGFTKYSEVPEGIKNISPVAYGVLSFLDGLFRNVDPDEKQSKEAEEYMGTKSGRDWRGTKSNISFYTPPEEPYDSPGEDVKKIIPKTVKPALDTPPPPAEAKPAIQAYFERLGIGPATPAINPSIALYKDLYGIENYPKAVEKFTGQSATAMGGGGLRGLMEYS